MTFEYDGPDFYKDMDRMAKYLSGKGVLIQKRRKDVPENERATTNWWAPVKKVGSVLDVKPDFKSEEDEMERSAMLGGYTSDDFDYSDLSFNEEDWYGL